MYLVPHDELKNDDKMKPNSTQSSGEVHGSQVNNIKVSSGATLLINSDGEMSEKSSHLPLFDDDGNPISSDTLDRRGRKKLDSIESQGKNEEPKTDGRRKGNPGFSYTPADENVLGVGERGEGPSASDTNLNGGNSIQKNTTGTDSRKRRHAAAADDPVREEKRLKAKQQFIGERLAALEGKEPPPPIFDDVEMEELLNDDNKNDGDVKNEDIEMRDINEENINKSKKEFRKKKNDNKSFVNNDKENLKQEAMKEIGIVPTSNEIKDKIHKRRSANDNDNKNKEKGRKRNRSEINDTSTNIIDTEENNNEENNNEEMDIFMDERQQDIQSFSRDTLPKVIKKNTAKVLTKLNKHRQLEDKKRENSDSKRKEQRNAIQDAIRPLFRGEKRKNFLWEDLLPQEKRKASFIIPSISVTPASPIDKRSNDTFSDLIFSLPKDSKIRIKSSRGEKRKVSPLWEDLLPLYKKRKIKHMTPSQFAGKKRTAIRETLEEDEERTQIPYKSKLLSAKRKNMNSQFVNAIGRKRRVMSGRETIEEDEERTQIPYKRRLLRAKRMKRKFSHIKRKKQKDDDDDDDEYIIPDKKVKYAYADEDDVLYE